MTKKQIQDAKNRINPTFIDIGHRKKPTRNYNVDSKAEKEGDGDVKQRKKVFKGWKTLVNGGFDHQFFDNAQLDRLEQKESQWQKYQ